MDNIRKTWVGCIQKQEARKASCHPLTNYFSSWSSSTSISQHNREDEGTNTDHDANVSDSSRPVLTLAQQQHYSPKSLQQQRTITLVLPVAALVSLPLPETHPPLTAQVWAQLVAASALTFCPKRRSTWWIQTFALVRVSLVLRISIIIFHTTKTDATSTKWSASLPPWRRGGLTFKKGSPRIKSSSRYLFFMFPVWITCSSRYLDYFVQGCNCVLRRMESTLNCSSQSTDNNWWVKPS